MNSKKSCFARVIALLLAIVMIMALAVGCQKKEDSGKGSSKNDAEKVIDEITKDADKVPKETSKKLSKSILSTVKNVTDEAEESTLGKLTSGASITISVDATKLMKEMIGQNVPLSALISIFMDDGFAALKAAAAYDGDEIADASLFFSGTELAIHSKALLRDKAYGIDLDKDFDALLDLLEDMLGIDRDEFEEYYDMIKSLMDSTGDFEELVKEGAEVITGSLDILAKALEDNGALTESKEDYDGVKCNCLTITLDADNIGDVIKDACAGLADYDELYDFLLKIGDTIADSALSDYADFDADDWEDQIDYIFDTIGDEDAIEEAVAELEDTDLDINIDLYLSASNNSLVAAEGTIEVEGEEMAFELKLGEDLSKSEEISFRMEMYGDEMYIGWIVDENTDKAYSAHTEISIPYEDEPFYIEVEWDKKSGDIEFVMDIDDGYQGFGFTGTLEKGDKKTVLTIEEISYVDYYDETTIPIDVIITIDYDAKMPSLPKYKSIAEMDEDDIYEVIDQIEEDVMDIRDDLMEKLG